MPQILAYCNLIIAVLYVCNYEVNANASKKGELLEYWKPNPELFEPRRAQGYKAKVKSTTTKKTKSTATTTTTSAAHFTTNYTAKSILRDKSPNVMYHKRSESENIRVTKRHPRRGVLDYDMNLLRVGDLLNRRMGPAYLWDKNSKKHRETLKKNHNHKNNVKPKYDKNKNRATSEDSEEHSSNIDSDVVSSNNDIIGKESPLSSQSEEINLERKTDTDTTEDETGSDKKEILKIHDDEHEKKKQQKIDPVENIKKPHKKDRIVPAVSLKKTTTKKDIRGIAGHPKPETNKNKKLKQLAVRFEDLKPNKTKTRVKLEERPLDKREPSNESSDASSSSGEDKSQPMIEKAFLRSTKLPVALMEPQHDEGGDEAHGPFYLNPHDLKSELEKILSHWPKLNATIEVLGRTAEYNDILVIKATEKMVDKEAYFRTDHAKNIYIDEQPEKKIVFIVHGLTVMGMANVDCLNLKSSFKTLLSFYYKHLDKFDIFLIPIANPDGYLAAHSDSKITKNMSPQGACVGVLLDRNFDVAWSGHKKYSSCSSRYPGPSPFSEVETRAIRDVLHYFGHKIVAYIHVHAGTYGYDSFKGDAILYPRGYTDRTSDDDRYIDLKGEIEETMKNASFQVMSASVDTLYNWYGQIYGASVDYAATVFGIPYSLEFVMQPYDDTFDAPDAHDRTSNLALKEIWGRLIDTTFKAIHKGTRGNEVKRKKK